MDRNTGKFTQYIPVAGDKTSISSFLVWAIFEDSQGNLWIGTHDGLNLSTTKPIHFVVICLTRKTAQV